MPKKTNSPLVIYKFHWRSLTTLSTLKNKMKTIITTSLLLFFTLVANADLREVDYKIGPQLFRDGDSIKIEEVKASSSKFNIGDSVTVRGTYNLASHPNARISIFVTQTEGDGKSEILPGQQLEIKKGNGEFELSIDIRHKGYLHVTFYPTNGSGFGGVYFGKSKQMIEIRDWTLDWYWSEPPLGLVRSNTNESYLRRSTPFASKSAITRSVN